MVVTVESIPQRLSGIGARHQATWQIILDRVFADAVLSNVGSIRWLVPEGPSLTELGVRRSLVREVSGHGHAEAWLGALPSEDSGASKIYSVIPFQVWVRESMRGRLPPSGWIREDVLFLYPWTTWALGLAMRAFRLLHLSYWLDRSLFAIRWRLVTRRPTWCAYVLLTWTRLPVPHTQER